MGASALATSILKEETKRNQGARYNLDQCLLALEECEQADDLDHAWHLLMLFQADLARFEGGDEPAYRLVLQQLIEQARRTVAVVRVARGISPLGSN